MIPKIIITVDGGMVQNVMSTIPVDFCMIDYDTEGAQEELITKIEFPDGLSEAICYIDSAEENAKEVNRLFKVVEDDFNSKENEN